LLLSHSSLRIEKEKKMSVPQLRSNEGTSYIQPSSGARISLPPWDQSFLQSYCDEINGLHGSRGDKYQELLGCLNETIQRQLTPEDFDLLGHNLLIIVQKMPSEILTRKGVQEVFAKILFFHAGSTPINLLKSFCSHLNMSVGIRTVIYQEIFGMMEFAIDRGGTFAKLESIGRCFSLVSHEMPSAIKQKGDLKKLTLSLEKSLISLLKNYCISINRRERGNPIVAYQGILNAIEEAFPLQETAEELSRLNHNFTMTTQLMQSGNFQFQDLGAQINRIKQRLVMTSRLYFTPLKDRLLEARRSSEVLSIQSEMQLVKSGLPQKVEPNLEKEIEKCISFSSHKFLTRSFVEHRNHVVDSQNTVSSPSSGELELTRRQNRSIYPILSIDGGGIRGIIPATVLVAIERFTNEPIASLFQLVGGTSTGGILTLGLTKPHPNGSGLPEYRAQDLLSLYTEQHSQIFRRNPRYREDTSELKFGEKVNESIHNPRYRTPTLFQDRFGDSCLSSALTDVVITANTHEAIVSKVCSVSMTALTGLVSFGAGLFGYKPTPIWSHDSMPKEVHLFTNRGLKSLSYSLGDLEKRYDFTRRYSYPATLPGEIVREYSIYPETTGDFLMADIAKVTSAAPSYFPPIRYNEKLFMDGGVLQNNPSIPCVLEALNRGHRRDSLFMLSLGTGIEPLHTPRADLGSSLTSLWFQTTQPHFEEDMTLMDMLDPGASYRFQYHFENHAPGLDDTDAETIAILQDSGNELVEENTDQIREVCRVLRPDSI
jgi:hypothetical protein